MPSRRPLNRGERELLSLLEDIDGMESVLDFVPYMTPLYHRPEHLRPLADAFYRAEREAVYICASTPPRHAKTESILHWAARHIQRHPEQTVAYVTYEASLAQSKSRKCKDIALRAGVQLRSDSQSAREWRTTAGGGMLATGVGGPLTGQGVDLLIVDDPIKNRKEAESITVRQAVHEWFTSTALSRVEPGRSVIVNMARWHDDDLVGRLAADTEIAWEVLNLAALDDTGRPLWPTRWPLEALDVKRRLVGEYDWASLYMGQPRPRGGYLFREPTRYRHADVAGARIAIACDPAATASTSADHSVICVVAAKGTGVDQTVDVLDVWRDQVEIPTLVTRLVETQKRWGAPLFVEAVGGFKGIPQTLRSINPKLRVVELHPVTDKFTRALPVAAAWNDARVRIPLEAPWVADFLSEVQRFTGKGDAHDDQVDALAHAFTAVDQRHIPSRRGATAVPGMV